MSKKMLIGLGIFVVIGVGVWFSYGYIFKSQLICWPYCHSMTDQDGENIKKQMSKTEQPKDALREKLQTATLDVTLYSSKQPTNLQVTLTNGKYEYQSPMCAPQLCTFTLAVSEFIDIDEDGLQDVVAIGSAWNGGNKTVQSAEIFLNKNGGLSYVGGIPIGTSPGIKSIATDKNQVTIEYNSTYNGAAGWSDPVKVTYRIENGKLVDDVYQLTHSIQVPHEGTQRIASGRTHTIKWPFNDPKITSSSKVTIVLTNISYPHKVQMELFKDIPANHAVQWKVPAGLPSGNQYELQVISCLYSDTQLPDCTNFGSATLNIFSEGE